MMKSQHILPLFFSSLTSLAQNSTNELETLTGFPPCDALISARLADRVVTASSEEYEGRMQFWNAASARYHPWCFFLPRTTEELATAIGTLSKTGKGAGDWHIAVRSGGHSFPGSNNVDRGVTIDLGNMNGSWYNAENKLASIQPGARWKDVYVKMLENYNVTVTGGRDGDVGVGGFLLGGGISYYTGTNGFGCDTILNYEVVLANGSTVQANGHENAELFKALKGGGPNFGIVTRFDVETMPAVDLAYGQRIVSLDYSDEVVENVVKFTDSASEHPHDHLITLYNHSPKINGTIILSIRVNTQGDLNTTAFDQVNAIPALSSKWNTSSLAAAAYASQLAGGYRSASETLTFRSSPSILKQAVSLHTALVTRLTHLLGAQNLLSSVILQPMPTSYSAISQRKGGNMLPPFTSNSIMWTGGVGVLGDDAALAIAETEFSAMTVALKDAAAAEGVLEDFVYMNYAHPAQDPLGSYGEDNVAFMKRVAAMYDPGEFWQRRVPGGFKVSRTG